MTRNVSSGAEAPRKGSIAAILLVVFIDLVGFSIIFPLFPAMLEHYLASEGSASLMGRMVHFLHGITAGAESDFLTAVLFGGALGSIYSFLQFVAAPYWGRLSDRVGRRRVLLITVSGTAFSYLLWVFSGSFGLLLLARCLGGVMAGNISVATAAVADVSSGRNRSGSMALVGLAFGLGFIVGPAIGGTASLLDLTEVFPGWERFGINPFSFAAFCALILSLINLVWLITRFPETLPAAGVEGSTERADPRLIGRIANPAIRLTCRVYFILLLAFSGMEFTLTFLAVERLYYQPHEMIWMFLFIGVILALAQGYVVRRFVRRTGEVAMTFGGILAGFLGLVLLSRATDTPLFYGGLALLAFGIGLTSPTLSALVSLYAGRKEQGRHLGAFRAYGALARAIGPLTAAVLFWRFGSPLTYLIGAGMMLLAAGLSLLLPKPFIPPEEPV